MAAEELREVVGILKTSQRGLARFLGTPERTFRDWIRSGPPEPVAILLRVMVRSQITMDDVSRLLDQPVRG